MAMTDLAQKKREEGQEAADILGAMRQARISRTESPAQAQDTRNRMIQGLCTEFFSACFEKAVKSGTANELRGTEMHRFFG